MRRVLIYWALILASLVEMAVFVTASNFLQLGVAIVVYPLLVYFIFRVLPKRATRVVPIATHRKTMVVALEPPKTLSEEMGIADIDKRGFLKLIGTAGLSFFLFSLFSKRAQVPFLERLTGGGVAPDITGSIGNKTDLEPTNGYRISEIDSEGAVTYYGFVKQGGAWFIMQEDTQVGSFRYSKGENGFPGNWVRREKLQYDYYHNVF